MIAPDPVLLRGWRRIGVLVDAASSPIDPASARAAFGDDPGWLVVAPWADVRPDPATPMALHQVQREARVLSRTLAPVVAMRPRLDLFLSVDPAAAVDLGFRLARFECVVWVHDGQGWRVATQHARPIPVDANVVDAPDDIAEAFSLGRALVGTARDELHVSRGSVPVLAIVGSLAGTPVAHAPDAAIGVARALSMRGDDRAVLDRLSPLRDTPGDRPEAALLRARSLWRTGADLLPEIDRGLALAPSDASLRLRVAGLLLEAGNAARAVDEVRRALIDGASTGDAHAVLADALLSVGAAAEASEALQRAVDAGGIDPERLTLLHERLGQALIRDGNTHTAVRLAEDAWSRSPDATTTAARARAWIADGRSAEATGLLIDALSADEATDPRSLRTLLDLLRSRRDHEALRQWCDWALARDVATPDVVSARADAAVALRDDDAVAWDERALMAAPERWQASLRRRLALGDVHGAEACLGDQTDTAAMAQHARLALWRGDLASAGAGAQAVLARDPQEGAARVVALGVAVLSGEDPTDRVAACLARAGTGEPSVEAAEIHCWHAEALRRRGRVAEAAVAVRRARQAAEGVHVPVLLEDLSCVLAAHPYARADHVHDARAWSVHRQWLDRLLDDPSILDRGSRAEILTALDGARARLGGNRASTTTIVRDGVLHALPPIDDPRHAAAARQLLIHTRSLDAVVQATVDAARRHPGDPFARTYGGEVLLWAGRYDLAETLLDDALRLDRRTVWAWIGLGLAQMLQGRVDEACDTWARGSIASGVEGPTLFVCRAEAHWRMGRLDEARRDVATALADKPHRLSAQILAALVAHDGGDAVPAVQLAESLATKAGSYWSEALATAPQAETPVDRLRAAWTCLRGNRSSSMPGYVTRGGAWREIRIAR